MSSGAFDISVQPLWQLYEAPFWSRTHVVPDIVARAQEVARELVDFRCIETGARRIAFARAGMGITLNSVALGFVTDAVIDILRHEGFEQAVVDLGEYRTLGRHPDGHPWRIGIRDPLTAGAVVRVVELDDTALAVSGATAHVRADRAFQHILIRKQEPAQQLADAAVIGPRATGRPRPVAICVGRGARARPVGCVSEHTRSSRGRTETTAAIGQA